MAELIEAESGSDVWRKNIWNFYFRRVASLRALGFATLSHFIKIYVDN